MLDNLKPCKGCGSTDLETKRGPFGYYVICRGCHTVGPTRMIIHDAEKEWNKEMAIPININTSYRDRVDRMVGYYISVMMSNRRLPGIDEKYIAAWAIKQIDAIDKALAERDGE